MICEEIGLELVQLVREIFGADGSVTLHEPQLGVEEEEILAAVVRSGFVSTVGEYVGEFEEDLKAYTGAKCAVAMNSGTAALHVALNVIGVEPDDEVLTQPVTFVATGNAIRYCGAHPVFIDIERETLGMCPDRLASFLEQNATMHSDGQCRNLSTGRRIVACMPVNCLGHPAKIGHIRQVCDPYNIKVVEDAAESLGSWIGKVHTGLKGHLGVLSFNGNKLITTGGGGALLSDDEELALRARHLSTTAKRTHDWDFFHDEVGFNYRLPNVNAALGCAQMKKIKVFLKRKRDIAGRYSKWASDRGVEIISEPIGASSNFWLNAFLMPDRKSRDQVLSITNGQQVMTRPLWTPLTQLPMYKDCLSGGHPNAHDIFDRLVCLPSSAVQL